MNSDDVNLILANLEEVLSQQAAEVRLAALLGRLPLRIKSKPEVFSEVKDFVVIARVTNAWYDLPRHYHTLVQQCYIFINDCFPVTYVRRNVLGRMMKMRLTGDQVKFIEDGVAPYNIKLPFSTYHAMPRQHKLLMAKKNEKTITLKRGIAF